ncbi:MAG TPA: LCP family protein, partial [Iamia sp.]|nr:LCP family protein [Iamia sp.]
MFTHLDDPQPPPPSGPLRAAVLRRVRRRRQRRAAVVGGVASVAALGVGAVAAVRDRVTPEQVEIAGLAEDPPAGGEPVTILVVGVDGPRPDIEGSRAELTDTIAVVRLDPAAGEMRMLTVPRDLAVDGSVIRQPIRSVLADDGPDGLIEVVRTELGIEVDHYVQVDFPGAVELVDAVGGIRVEVDQPVRDQSAGLELAAGCQALDGAGALRLGRARHVEVQQADGGWRADGFSALGRDLRGAAVAAALLQAAGRVGPSDLPALAVTGLRSVTVDDAVDTADVERWARQAGSARFVPMGLPVDSG